MFAGHFSIACIRILVLFSLQYKDILSCILFLLTAESFVERIKCLVKKFFVHKHGDRLSLCLRDVENPVTGRPGIGRLLSKGTYS